MEYNKVRETLVFVMSSIPEHFALSTGSDATVSSP